MARSRLVDPINDLISDGGAILWSFVQGEQLEFPLTLGFVENILITDAIIADPTKGYTLEAKVLEANNVANQLVKPTAIKTGGIVTPITVRVPYYAGVWSAGTLYLREDVVLYSGAYYKCLVAGNNSVNGTPGTTGSGWQATTPNKVYIQYPNELANDWTTLSFLSVTTAIYGFFELRVTEPSSAGSYSLSPAFVRTWKPVRGMVEILYSPTLSSDDLSAT
jgi:hypothetical protein